MKLDVTHQLSLSFVLSAFSSHTEMDATSQGSQEQDEVPQSSIASIAEAHPPDLQNKDPAVIEDLRGNYKLLVNRQLPTVLDWLRVVIRV